MKKVLCIVLALTMVFAACFALAACGSGIANNTEHLDSVTKTLHLTKEYKDKSFFEDGIGEAEVDYTIDGDTTRFRLKIGMQQVTIRYHNVDTPESTGGVEKWGKAASMFTKKQLESATLIVLEATTTPPQHDSFGSRYLGYVWYKTAEDDELKLLNLELVENGFSTNKGTESAEYPYYGYFKQAEQAARGIKLRCWSDLDDPDYVDEAIPITIKYFWENINEKVDGNILYNWELDNDQGAKVEIIAFLTNIYVSGTGTHTFTAVQYDPETGTYSQEISVYAAYSSNQASRMKIGDLYKIVGVIQKHNDKWQLAGIVYDRIEDGKNTTFLRQSSYYLLFDSNRFAETNRYLNNYSKNLYSDVTVTEVGEPVDGKLTFKGTAKLCTGVNTFDNKAETFTFTVNVPESYSGRIAVGSTLRFNGLQLEEDSGEITIVNYADIKFA